MVELSNKLINYNNKWLVKVKCIQCSPKYNGCSILDLSNKMFFLLESEYNLNKPSTDLLKVSHTIVEINAVI